MELQRSRSAPTEIGMSLLLQVLALSAHSDRSKQPQKEFSSRREQVGCCLCHIMLSQLPKCPFENGPQPLLIVAGAHHLPPYLMAWQTSQTGTKRRFSLLPWIGSMQNRGVLTWSGWVPCSWNEGRLVRRLAPRCDHPTILALPHFAWRWGPAWNGQIIESLCGICIGWLRPACPIRPGKQVLIPSSSQLLGN